MARRAEGRFQRFLDEAPDSGHRFPLLHTTDLYNFMDLCSGESIDPGYCRHFKDNLTYLFYGRPAYRTKKSEFTDLAFNWPVVFIIDPDKIEEILRVYPFDTGAYFIGLYDRYFASSSRRQDFELPGSLEYASKLVSTFYADTLEYLYGRSKKNVNIPLDNFEAQGVSALAREPSHTQKELGDSNTRDERSSAIEVQIKQRIVLKRAATGIILPEDCLTLEPIVEALERWNFGDGAIHSYRVNGYHGADSLLGKLYAIVEGIYRERGYI